MTGSRMIVVALRSAESCGAALRAGEDLASAFRSSIRALRVEQAAFLELGDLPAAFLPRGVRTAGGGTRQAMTVALRRETRRVAVELERFSAGARVSVAAAPPQGAEAAAPGDILVTTLDMSRPRLSAAVAEACRMRPPGGGVLIVPESRPCRSGPVVAVADGRDDPAVDAASAIAATLGAPTLVVLADGSGSEGAVLDAGTVGPAGARFVVCREPLLDRVLLDGPDALTRRFRTPLLVLAPEWDR